MDSTIWSKYWKDAHINCFGDEKENYSGTLKSNWYDFFHKIQPNNSILDLCCGNGSLESLFKEYNESLYKSTKIVGVDYADLLIPEDIKADKNVSFKIGTNIEKLPFEDNSFDVLISNFGVEYSNLEDSISEMIRVLKPLGRVQFISHVKESRLIAKSNEIQHMLDEFLSESSLFHTFQLLVKNLIVEDKNSSEHYRNLLNEWLNIFVNKYGEIFLEFGFIDFIRHILSNLNPKALEAMSLYEKDIILYNQRLVAMVSSAVIEEEFLQKFSKIGLKSIRSKIIKDFYNNSIALMSDFVK